VLSHRKNHPKNERSAVELNSKLRVKLTNAAVRQSRLNSNRPESLQDLIKECRTKARLSGHLDVLSQKLRYEDMAIALQILGRAIIEESVRKEIRDEAKRAGIPETTATPIALLISKLCMRSNVAAASQQAQALNGALLKNIAPADFSEYLKHQGGITKLAKFFRKTAKGNGVNTDDSVSAKRPHHSFRRFKFTHAAATLLTKAELDGLTEIRMLATREGQSWLVETIIRRTSGSTP
jgi:hypothetical protein